VAEVFAIGLRPHGRDEPVEAILHGIEAGRGEINLRPQPVGAFGDVLDPPHGRGRFVRLVAEVILVNEDFFRTGLGGLGVLAVERLNHRVERGVIEHLFRAGFAVIELARRDDVKPTIGGQLAVEQRGHRFTQMFTDIVFHRCFICVHLWLQSLQDRRFDFACAASGLALARRSSFGRSAFNSRNSCIASAGSAWARTFSRWRRSGEGLAQSRQAG
jgi:hypothetical protein